MSVVGDHYLIEELATEKEEGIFVSVSVFHVHSLPKRVKVWITNHVGFHCSIKCDISTCELRVASWFCGAFKERVASWFLRVAIFDFLTNS